MTRESKPVSVEVDLTMLQDAGVLMAVNERTFWAWGLALAWTHDPDTGKASGLMVTEWDFGDGHQENIGLEEDDPIGTQRRIAFGEWAAARAALMPDAEERDRALAAAAPPPFGVVAPTL